MHVQFLLRDDIKQRGFYFELDCNPVILKANEDIILLHFDNKQWRIQEF